jgi:3-hydroxyacyl-CoA dehydrogenase/enoyl-CoA hydratase/3-hydroxybutyryl-CoA epimerase
LLGPYLNEGVWLVSEGVEIETLDAALLKFGMPMGPMELIDEVGVDVAEKVAHILEEGLGDRMQVAPMNSTLVKAGRLGKKTGAGLYQYEKDGKVKKFDPAVYEILGVKPSAGAKISEQEMVDRCILLMVNEASRCLEEKVVLDAETVDLGMIMGTGFPPFKGGLLRYADQLGLSEVVSRLQAFESRLGERFTPSPTLRRLAETHQSFYEAFQSQG